MKKKGLTKKGKAPKSRVYKKSILQKHKTLLIANFFEAVLPMFKSLILIFKQGTPQVHKLHLRHSEVTRDIFACILKHESIKGLTGSKLKKLNIKNELRKTKDFFIDASNEKLTRKLRHENKADRVKEFQVCVKRAFINTAIYMQVKFPLTNKFLMRLSGLDPTAIGHSTSYACLKKLADFFPAILTSTEKTDSYLKNISTLQLDESLPSALEENDVPVRLDLCWAEIFQTSNYPVLSQVVKACLSDFSVPHVEFSFSLMSNILDKRSNRMNIDTYNAMMTIKYSLQSKASSEIYRRPDVLYEPIDKEMCYYVRSSHSRYKKGMDKNQLEKTKGAVSRGVKV